MQVTQPHTSSSLTTLRVARRRACAGNIRGGSGVWLSRHGQRIPSFNSLAQTQNRRRTKIATSRLMFSMCASCFATGRLGTSSFLSIDLQAKARPSTLSLTVDVDVRQGERRAKMDVGVGVGVRCKLNLFKCHVDTTHPQKQRQNPLGQERDPVCTCPPAVGHWGIHSYMPLESLFGGVHPRCLVPETYKTRLTFGDSVYNPA